jgi:competence protein ComEC
MPVASQEHPIHHSPFKRFLPFFWLCLACAAGILLAEWVAFPVWFWILGTILSVTVWLLPKFLSEKYTLTHALRQWTRAENRLPGAILALFFFVGGWRYGGSQVRITPDHVAFYNDRGYVELVGVLVEPPAVRESSIQLKIRTESIVLRGVSKSDQVPMTVTGLVLARVPLGGDYQYGDRLLVSGQLETPFEGGDFSYRDYLARKNVYSLVSYAQAERIGSGEGNPIRSFLFRLRDSGYQTIQFLFPSPESDLLAGILLGQDQGLSPALQADFRRTGTTHIIAISGFNMAILAGLFSSVFSRIFGQKTGAIIAILGIVGFTILVGGEAAVVRAAIMGALGVMGGMFGRRQNGLNSLGLAGLGMMLIEPNILWDVGFQLSVAATLGMVLYAQPLEEGFARFARRWVTEEQAQRLVAPVSEFLLFTLAAQVMTLPITAYHFGGLSWIALFANPLILPAQSILLILGGLAMLLGMILPGLGRFASILALPFVRYTIRIVSWMGRMPGGDLELPEVHILWVALFYGVLFALTLLPREERRALIRKAFSMQTALLILAGLVFLTWERVLSRPDGYLHLTLLDSKGTVLIQTPAGNAVLLGGGASPSSLRQSLGQMLPAGGRGLDAVIVGSARQDDLNGLTGILYKYPIQMALWGIDPNLNQYSRSFYLALYERGIPITTIETGQRLQIDQEIVLNVVWSGERGAVLWLEWDRFSALLPVGKVEGHWLTSGENPDVLLLPDGISAKAFPLDQVNAWTPAVILFPLDDSDFPLRGEHPLLSLLDGYPILTSFDHGWVRVTTDGQSVWVKGEH